MRENQALFFELEPLLIAVHRLGHGAAAVLRDYAALGYDLFALAPEPDPRDVDAVEERLACEARMHALLGYRFRCIVSVDRGHEPRPIWDVARCFQLNLRRSILLANTGVYAGACRSAGVGRVVPSGPVSPAMAVA